MYHLLLLAQLFFIWVSGLIKPLKLIRNYIEDIRKDKQSELKIDRGDEIGFVSDELCCDERRNR